MTNSGRRLVIAGALVVSGLVVAGCASAPATGSGSVAGATGSATSSTSQVALQPLPAVAITPTDGTAGVRLDAPVTVTTDVGSLDTVVVHSAADPTALPGSYDAAKHSWTAAVPLDPGTSYVVQATARSTGGSSTAQAAFSTMATPQKLLTTVTPADGSAVGVGMPFILRFSHPVDPTRQAAVVSHLAVQTGAVPISGAWHWFGNQEVHYRPENYWPSGTAVTLSANLRGVEIGGGVWGLGNFTSAFTVGAKHVSIIDAATHQMQVFTNDQLAYTWGVSAGREPTFPTLSGTLIVRYKTQSVHMDSCSTFGGAACVPGTSNYYSENVYWDTAISTTGYFVHAAPWDVAQQGHVNISHGCVNITTAEAITFYNYSLQGDIVQVKNTSYTADASDGEGDWQIPFASYANTPGLPPATTTVTPAPAPGAGSGAAAAPAAGTGTGVTAGGAGAGA